jgi:segregation and condensation protein B
MMEISNLIPHIEALIFASEKPLTTLEITDLINNAFGFMEDKIVLDQIESAIEGILEKYKAEFYPFEVRESGGGWQFLTKKDFHKTVAQLNGDKFLKRLSTAALETLSIVAYKQPVTKSEIEAIRGVSSDYAIQKLLEKDLIVITGRNETLPGHPLVYGTSKNFMDYFGLNSTDDLPKLKEVLDDNIVAPTIVGLTGEAGVTPDAAAEEAEGILPSENGVHLNGTEVSFSEEEGAAEDVQPGLGQELSDEADENVEAADEAYEMETDEEEEAIAEEVEALDEEADEVLDEIASDDFEEGEEEGVEGFEEEEDAYITPEELEEFADDDSTTFAVDEDGELIEESQNGNEGDEDNDDEDKDDEKKDGEEDKK